MLSSVTLEPISFLVVSLLYIFTKNLPSNLGEFSTTTSSKIILIPSKTTLLWVFVVVSRVKKSVSTPKVPSILIVRLSLGAFIGSLVSIS